MDFKYSLNDIATKCGVSIQSLYKLMNKNKPYFNNLEKQKLFLNFDSRINNKSNERNQFTIDSNKSNNVEYISSSELYTLPNYKTKTLNFFHRAKKAFSNKNKKNKIRNDIYHINKNFRFITSNDVEKKKKMIK